MKRKQDARGATRARGPNRQEATQQGASGSKKTRQASGRNKKSKRLEEITIEHEAREEPKSKRLGGENE